MGQVCILGNLQHPGQILVRIQTILNGRLDQDEHHCATGGTLGCVGKQEFLSVNDEGFNAPFSAVIGDLQSAVLQVVG